MSSPQPQLTANNPLPQQANQHQPPPNPYLSASSQSNTDPKEAPNDDSSKEPLNKQATSLQIVEDSYPSPPPEPNLNNSSNNATESKMDVTSCKQDIKSSNAGSHNITEVPEPPNSQSQCISSEDLELPPPPEELLDETEDNQSEASYSFRKDDDISDVKEQPVSPTGQIETDEKPQMSISERIKLFNNGELKQNNSVKNRTVINNSPPAPNSQNVKTDSANIDKPMEVPAVKSCLNSDTKQPIATPSSETQDENKAPTCPEVESECKVNEHEITNEQKVIEESDNTQSQHIQNKQDNVKSVGDSKLEASINNTASLEPNLPNVDSTKGSSIKDVPDTSNKKEMANQYSIDYEDGFC